MQALPFLFSILFTNKYKMYVHNHLGTRVYG